MSPPILAIVTSLCKGETLHTVLHIKRKKMSTEEIVRIAEQIAQGMGYLHHRGIVHNRLKTKNIFLENGRAVLTHFGVVSVARRLYTRPKAQGVDTMMVNRQRDCIYISKEWLCYLPPEIMKSLRAWTDESSEDSFDRAFTKGSDIYAFGTIWFELITCEWPWKHSLPETIIWLVGRGLKPSFENLAAPPMAKNISLMCWALKQNNRPDFDVLNSHLGKIPKTRMARSPSQPERQVISSPSLVSWK